MMTWPVRVLSVGLALFSLTGCYITARHQGSTGAPFTTIHTFTGNAGGSSPNGVTANATGIIYGTTQADGNCPACGIIYRLKPPASGSRWTFDVLHKFVLSKGGNKPIGTLALYNSTLYGTTSAGGDAICGCGVVFAMGQDGGGYTVLHTFKNVALGKTPAGGLLIDTDGTIYGTTSAGGANGAGVIFKLGAGDAYTVLHDLVGDFGEGPQGDPVFGADSAIYGTQFTGGSFGRGAIFRITKTGTYSVLQDFSGVTQPAANADGANPDGHLTVASDGTIYGTTSTGAGPSGLGNAWSIKQAGAKWNYTQLHVFDGNDAAAAHSGLILAPDGSLYGTGSSGGANQAGALFHLLSSGKGSRPYRTLHSFNSGDVHGDTPHSALVFVNSTIYGSTLLGGDVKSAACPSGCGTVFSYAP